jgi:hypothetical protein
MIKLLDGLPDGVVGLEAVGDVGDHAHPLEVEQVVHAELGSASPCRAR